MTHPLIDAGEFGHNIILKYVITYKLMILSDLFTKEQKNMST